ncbi:MAG: hypothetical protein QXS05_03280 [Candidatus Bathyarchaeia archaeon]
MSLTSQQRFAGQGSLPRRERRRIAMEVLNGFVVWFGNRDYAPKTIKVYVEAVQSLAKYYNIPISLRYVRLKYSVMQY